MANFLTTCFLMLISTQLAQSSGVFELKVHSFTTISGACKLSTECQIFFRVCLKHSQDVISPEPPCTYGTGMSEIFNADQNSISSSAPITVPFNFKWPGTVSLIIEAWNAESSSEQSTGNVNNLITRLATKRRLAIGEDWSKEEQNKLSFSYRVVCDEFYYGKECSDFCRPRNDTFGHYNCDAAGNRICLLGWKGAYCAEPICSPDCSEHGSCEAPGRCKCKYGWQGPHCDECQRHPGCIHGTCKQPFECTCKEGWGGLMCDQDLNFCTNHKPCMNDATCSNTGQGSYTCTCKPGFSGTDCEIETNECDSNPCKNGGSCNDLVNGYSCSCPQGFYGKNCEISAMTCADGPCFNGGTCMPKGTGGYTCQCRAGYMGSNCEKKIDRCSSDPCANGGQCLDLGHRLMCTCRPGFKGSYCEINIDDCARNPCQNAGTCVDGINDYTCSCTLGFTGKDCSIRSDACSLTPCENGGTCYTHFTGAVCKCPPGFMGTRCEHEDKPTRVASPGFPAALAVSFALGLITLSLVICAAIAVLRQMRRGRKAAATNVRNNLETVNNRVSLTPLSALGLKEKEAFLIPGGPYKVSNKEVALSSNTMDTHLSDKSNYKQKMMDYNLTIDEKHHTKNKLDMKNSESTLLVPPLNYSKEGLYHPVYIIPDHTEQCVFATEV